MAKKILVVDDSESIRMLVSTILENAGFEVERAVDGSDALHVLDSNSFHLIITDLNMPIMDGISLIEKVRVTPHHNRVPIIMLTTESHTFFKDHARTAGATGWVVKPFVADKLLAVINKVLR
jgi:two-component system, chemotaxis family, chemotaxis protein CheY